MNLTVNARDALALGGTLTIDTGNLHVGEEFAASRPNLNPGEYVRLRVSDSGTGMSPEVPAQAFEPFFTTKPKGQGTGVGLATVYGIITHAGGYAQLYSEVGVGTTFTALLPASRDPRTEIDQPAAAPPAGRPGATILVVEDMEELRRATARLLARSGYRVLTAANGQEAIVLAAAYPERIDLLLTDVVMPGMLGKELADRLLAIHGVPTVYMSGYAYPGLAAQGTLDEGATLLEKPFSDHQLLATVADALPPAGPDIPS